MRVFLSILFVLAFSSTKAVDFTKLSRNEPITTAYPATFKCYVDVSLFVNAVDVYNDPIFIRVSYIIGIDTLNDNILVNGSFNKVVKQLFLDEGERLTTIIYLNNGETEVIDGINGSLRIVRNPDFKPTEDQGRNTFLGGVWKSDQTPLFRVGIKDSVPQVFRLKFSMNENFEFDNFYFKMKVISPSEGILMLNRVIRVNEKKSLEMRKKTFTVDFEDIDLSSIGSYYFQVMQNMSGIRINGIDKIEYEIVPQ